MNEIPLHPAIVHIPVGLAMLMPAVFIGLYVFIKKEKLPAAAFLIAVLLQTVLVVSAIASLRTGEAEEDRIEEAGITVPHEAIEEHEDLAKMMTGAALATLLLSGASLKKSRFSGGLQIGAIALSFAVTGLAITAGHHGGKLVYVYGAAGQGPFAEQPANIQTDEHHSGESDH
ncbi:MAG: hypothetical protein CVV45_01305 [Spirochaetae bacterium HGW-Spirochaetae-10]|nr:MAG: hypothetical protein CVV45_01305 [Spirochaetae bacterium HGW-Spirochaetae-10]